MNPSLQVQNVAFETDGTAHIAYFDLDEDVKSNGLIHSHTLIVPAGADYDDEIRTLMEAVHALIADAADDLRRLGPPEQKPADVET